MPGNSIVVVPLLQLIVGGGAGAGCGRGSPGRLCLKL